MRRRIIFVVLGVVSLLALSGGVTFHYVSRRAPVANTPPAKADTGNWNTLTCTSTTSICQSSSNTAATKSTSKTSTNNSTPTTSTTPTPAPTPINPCIAVLDREDPPYTAATSTILRDTSNAIKQINPADSNFNEETNTDIVAENRALAKAYSGYRSFIGTCKPDLPAPPYQSPIYV